MPRKSRRRNRRNRRVRGTKRIRGTRRVNRVRRFRISRGGEGEGEGEGEGLLKNVLNRAKGLFGKGDQATGVSGNGLTTPEQGLVGSLKNTATDVFGKFTKQAHNSAS
jgi:hypothetical protein